MTRRRFYAPLIAFSPDGVTVTLGAEESRHLRDVLRLKTGDEVYIFDGGGREFQCEVQTIEKNSATLAVKSEAEPARPESSLALTLAVALLKGEKFDLVVQKATELGVTRLVPLITARADVRIREPNDAKRKAERWQRIALESAKQCGRARLMEVELPMEFDLLVTPPAREAELRLMFAERDGTSLAQIVGGSSFASVTALIGSEGGWTDDEIKRARDDEWRIVTLGGRTLRAETAAIAVAALLQHRFGDLV